MPVNIKDLTIGQAEELVQMLGSPVAAQVGLNSMVGRKVIIRTYSAGVWFGALIQKSGNEVIIENARRLWRWQAAESISLSAVALYGIKSEGSKVAPPVDSAWLEAIEIIPTTEAAAKSIQGAHHATAQ